MYYKCITNIVNAPHALNVIFYSIIRYNIIVLKGVTTIFGSII